MKPNKVNNIGLSTDFENELLKDSIVYMNVNQEFIITTKDKITIVLMETKEILSARRDWLTPLGLFLSFLLTFSTADFKDAFGLSKDIWYAVFFLFSICSVIWLFITLNKLFKNRGQSDPKKIVEKIKLKDSLIANKKPINNKDILLKEIQIDNSWSLNHWGSKCSKIIEGKMIFTGSRTDTSKNDDGSHIDLKNILEIGKSYKISCFAESIKNTNAKFKLWCHDNAGSLSYGSDVSTDYKTPSEKGELIELIFKATHNKDIRIHFQYLPGEGTIVVSNLKIYSFSI